jgi:hypothetical protein
LWAGRNHIVGLLATPDAEPEAWPGVIVRDGQGLTLATDAKTLLPQFLLHHVLSRVPETALQLGDRWSRNQPHILALHRVLGGSDEALNVVGSVLIDAAARAAFNYSDGEEATLESAYSALARQIDRSNPFSRYAEWLDAAITRRWVALAQPGEYGSFGRRALCTAQRLSFAEPAAPKVPVAFLLQMIEGNAGIDSGVPAQPSWTVRVGAASGETALVEAAMELDHAPQPDDSVGAALIKALVTEGTSYRGFAHAEAAVALDERGEPSRAWGALQSAAWWAARSLGEAPPAMLGGSRFMAERHNWDDIRWVLQRATSEG